MLLGYCFSVASRSADDRFFGGPRFGRSGAGSVILGNTDLDTRNPERFFIGSRYGKRSELERNSIIIFHQSIFVLFRDKFRNKTTHFHV